MSRTSRRLVATIAGPIVLAASMWCAASPADAGEYDVWSCRGPAGQPLSSEAWQPRESDTAPGDVWVDDDCATGGPVVLNLTDSGTGPRRSRLDLEFDLPRGAVITDFRLRRAISAAALFGPPYSYVAAVGERGGGVQEDWGCASTLILPYFNCSFEGSVIDPDDPSNLYQRTGVSLDRLSAWVGCVAANGCNPPFVPPSARFTLFESVVTIADNVPPTVAEIGGSLIGPRPATGPADLFVRATDSNAGVEHMYLDVDGVPYQSILVGGADCSRPFEVPRPCPGDAGRVFTVDAGTLSPGLHVASGTVTDAAGNATPFGPVSFEVAEPAPGPGLPQPDNGVPAVTDPTIALGSGRVTHKPGAKATVSGRLTTSTGAPVAGAVLQVRSTQLAVPDPAPVRLPDVTTGADGGFSLRVPGQGARRLEVSFAPTAGAATTSSSVVRVESRLKVVLKARPKRIRIGRASTFAGRLAGAGPSARGVPVEIQARSRGRWQTVATVASRSNGRFSWRYRFRFVKRDALFSFRAVVRSVPGWPWATVRSGVAKVRIKARRSR